MMSLQPGLICRPGLFPMNPLQSLSKILEYAMHFPSWKANSLVDSGLRNTLTASSGNWVTLSSNKDTAYNASLGSGFGSWHVLEFGSVSTFLPAPPSLLPSLPSLPPPLLFISFDFLFLCGPGYYHIGCCKYCNF